MASTRNATSTSLRCLQAANGLELWRAEHPARRMAQDHGGGTLTTPAVAGDRVYVSEREGRLACYDAGTGRVLWSKELAPLYDVDPGGYGFAASPVVLGERVIVAADRLFAFDAHAGDLEWSTESLEAVYGTPTPFASRTTPCLAVLGQKALDLVALEDGARLATFPCRSATTSCARPRRSSSASGC